MSTNEALPTLAQSRQDSIHQALLEDVGPCDWTAMLIANETQAFAELRVREEAVLCGVDWFNETILKLDPSAIIEWRFKEGDLLQPNTIIAAIKANARALMTAERTALNFLQLLSATATQTQRFVKAIEGASSNERGCRILDTRKTIPGLRLAQKYAVTVGGGENQRLALWDGILIKENHILAAGGITAAIQAAEKLKSGVPIQVEVEDLAELREALEARANSILLDNFSLEHLREAVNINQGRALLEASGGVNLETVRAIAATGVDRISVGSLTKDIQAIDYSLRVTARNGERIVG
jgi:nicotinate-nucleotide pyrophosphorylase (carboxylating)